MLALLKNVAVQLLVSNNSEETAQFEEYFSWDIEPTLVRPRGFIRPRNVLTRGCTGIKRA